MKKIFFVFALIFILAGGLYIVVELLRDDTPSTEGTDDGSSSQAMSSSSLDAASQTNFVSNIAANLVRDFPTNTLDENLKMLRQYSTLTPEIRTSVKTALATALAELSQRDRSIFEMKVLCLLYTSPSPRD